MMKKFLFSLLAAGIGVCGIAQEQLIWSEDFESAEVWAVDSVEGWTFIDLDERPTYSMTNYTFPNQAYTGVAIVYDAAEVDPPYPASATYQGNQGLYFYAAVPGGGVTANNDWAISPQVQLGDDSRLTFWARSITAQYGLERMAIGVSNTGTSPSDFTIVTPGTYIEVPAEWTEYEIDLGAWDGQAIHFAIHYQTADAYILMTDQFEIWSSGLSTSDVAATRSTSHIYPNPARDVVNVQLAEGFDVANTVINVYNLKGQLIQSVKGVSTLNVSHLTPGAYIVEFNDGVLKQSRKLMKK
ncbi:MAG: choice-of-anchor J domain-containing protein [Weeksellaceae bacterium]|nr:choice-of-anchor J domain-containing protein [Weeksellaceae bacterium]